MKKNQKFDSETFAMTTENNTPDTHQKRLSSSGTLKLRMATYVVCIGILSCIILPLAVIVNFGMFTAIFKKEMVEHWNDYQPPRNPLAHGIVFNLQVVKLESRYNSIARMMNDICVSITGEQEGADPRNQTYGSGFVLPGQQVLTNYHVIENAKKIYITSYTGGKATFPACIVTVDPANDLALLKAQTSRQLSEASIGNSDIIDAGDLVFAMGNAFGSGNLFTSGMVSDRTRSFVADGREYRNMIRTDTYTYPGSSGGPLVNIHGEVIGINTVIYNPKGDLTGISFAIPINRIVSLGNPTLTGLGGNPYLPGSPNNNGHYSLAA
jgi:S1-C subfamily serine protease